MAIEELSPDEEGRRFHVVALSAGWDAETVRALLDYKKVSSVYRLWNGEQRLTLPQMKAIARAAAGKGEWRSTGWSELFFYLQGARRLGFQDPPEGDDGQPIDSTDFVSHGSANPGSRNHLLEPVAA